MSAQSCFGDRELLDVAFGDYPKGRRAAVESHLASCRLCRMKLGAFLEQIRSSGEESGSGFPERRGSARLWRGAAAASLLLAIAAGGILSRSTPDPEGGSRRAVPVFLDGTSKLLSAPGDVSASFRLPDGSLLELLPGACARIDPPVGSDRILLEIMRGVLQADVVPRKGEFRLVSPAGEIRVAGTRFRARRLGLFRPDPGRDPTPERPVLDVLCVDVFEGKVYLANAHGRIAVTAGIRGVALADRAPARVEQGGAPENILAKFAAILEPQGYAWWIRPGMEAEAEFLATLYQAAVGDEPDVEVSPHLRAALPVLERMQAR